MKKRYVVIMAGGRGERFWPQSRLKKPKHLLPIVGESPMLAQTVDRLSGLVPPEQVFVITNAEQRDAVLESCPGLLPERVIGEPQGRDTAAAVGLAALLVDKTEPGAGFALLPADHVIADGDGFRKVLEGAFDAAEKNDFLVTIGIGPDFPSTGYGYLKKGQAVESTGVRPVHRVEKFVEKPNLEKAEEYLQEGGYFWNAGMFVWRPQVILSAIREHAPELSAGLDELSASWMDTGSVDQAMDAIYPKLKKISIDFAVMEKAAGVVMLESDFDWDDVGEWPAIARHYPADEQGNVFKGNGVALDASGNLSYAEQGHTISLLGVKDLIVVQSGDATLVCHKDCAQEVKAMAQEACRQNPDLA
ncbi:sugar phosphate nucleotidyltransferase [Opitutales bacterium]|nr:sugar phosphate nucleotidyltransferase [Opitutales bacterium]